MCGFSVHVYTRLGNAAAIPSSAAKIMWKCFFCNFNQIHKRKFDLILMEFEKLLPSYSAQKDGISIFNKKANEKESEREIQIHYATNKTHKKFFFLFFSFENFGEFFPRQITRISFKNSDQFQC